MKELSLEDLKAYRARTFGLLPSDKLKSPTEAASFVDARGFVYFWPIKGIPLPNLWMAVAGDRPVPNEHDDPGHITWGWKDNALGKKIWYYGKILHRKATVVSLEIAPYFYALTENYGSHEEDYLIAYEEGTLTQAAKLVYEALLDEGPLNTIDLKRAARLTNAKPSEFSRALETLQKDFKILPIGVSDAGAWHYSHIYEIVPRHFPDLPEQARLIGESAARRKLLTLYFEMLGASGKRDAAKLFQWPKPLLDRTLEGLVEKEILVGGMTHPKEKGEWFGVKGFNSE
ncbi:MAG: winged helix DNA-binding domain-containing protein [Anaerolineae bacterium]|nr:winged helix DNA-binding domain-containing protein [Anaerolineae bacterium]